MKKMMLALAAMILTNTAVMAQSKSDNGKKSDKTEMVKIHTQNMANRYQLTEKQTEQLLELNTRHADNMRAAFGGRGMRQGSNRQQSGRQQLTDEQRRQLQEQRQANSEAYKEELRKILTPDQMKQYEADEAQVRNGGRRGGRQGRNR